MITKITGEVVALNEETATIRLGGLEYEVLIPEYTRRQLQDKVGTEVSLFTIDYLEGNPMQGRMIPRLIGFLSAAEREFFELFCSVDGVGIRKALRAMVRPVKELAAAIEEKDVKLLATLPGVGPSTAERIVAKLHRKVSMFALMVSPEVPSPAARPDVISETFEVLVRLGHSEADARRLIDAALATGQKFEDVQSLIQVIYQQSHVSDSSQKRGKR